MPDAPSLEALASGMTPQHRYMALRSFASEPEHKRMAEGSALRWPHMRPDSVLICPIGYHWKPGAWQRVIDMMMHASSQGIYCGLSEIQDRCFQPFDAIGTMRNEAVLQAQVEGFEWLMMVDNDVMPERDTLLRLLRWSMPIVAPYVAEPGTGKQLSGPPMQVNTGLHKAKWTVLSMLLFNTMVFNAFPAGAFWENAMGADEGYHFMKLYCQTGHQPWIDSNTQLVVQGRPCYPLATNRLPKEEREAYWWSRTQAMQMKPDRRPGDPGVDPRVVVDGEYLPFDPGVQQQILAMNREGGGPQPVVPASVQHQFKKGPVPLPESAQMSWRVG